MDLHRRHSKRYSRTKGRLSVWNGKPTPLEEVSNLARSASDKGQPILIAGDEEAHYGVVVSVLDSLQKVGIENVSLAVGGESP